MKKFLKIIFQILLVILGVMLVLVFMMFSAKSEIVPDIYAFSEDGKSALAIRGAYHWNSFSDSLEYNGILPDEYEYTNQNVLLVKPEEKIIFKNSNKDYDCYKLYSKEMKYYDDSNKEYIVSQNNDSKLYTDLKYLEIKAPSIEGIYIYNFTLSYHNKGNVSYGVKVVVSTEPNYEITDFLHYRNTNLKDKKSIEEILNLLPYAKYKKGFILQINTEPYVLQVNYDGLTINKDSLLNNTIALLVLIPDLSQVVYKTENEVYIYTRMEIESLLGRSLKDYSDNMELWKKEVLFKEKVLDSEVTKDEIYSAIIRDVISQNVSGDKEKVVIIDTNSFLENSVFSITNVDRSQILRNISEIISIVYDMSLKEYNEFHFADLGISLDKIEKKLPNSGDEIGLLENNWIFTIRVDKNYKTQYINYEVKYLNENWEINKK